MKKIIAIREGEKIYYKVKKRVFYFWWTKYKINEYSFYYKRGINSPFLHLSKTCAINFKSKSEAELFINWKDIKYLDNYIRIGCNSSHNSTVYVVYDIKKICSEFYKKIFYNIEDAKSFIEELPRTINVYDNYK